MLETGFQTNSQKAFGHAKTEPLASVYVASLASATAAQDVASVIDGDTIEQNGITYRIHGIDAPEYGQNCGDRPCGRQAVDAMAVLAEGQRLDCVELEQDRCGRSITKCSIGGVDIGAAMVSTGNAWAFVRFSDYYLAEEAQARAEGLGIWQGDATPPWVYREQRWNDASSEAPEGCPIKGNISQNGKIDHRSVRNSVYRPPALFHVDRPQPPNGEKRSLNIMANWFTAVSHPLTVREVFSCPRIAR
ncbi:MAG: thermonuclease family protein [Pseudomonadota bacterium]